MSRTFYSSPRTWSGGRGASYAAATARAAWWTPDQVRGDVMDLEMTA
jgi:hypothetical protein